MHAVTPKPTLLTLAGTRPELLKLAPLIRLMREPDCRIATKTCFSGQHVEILNSVLGDVGVEPDVDFRVPPVVRTLSQTLACLIERVDAAVASLKPDGVIVQGDTNTVLAGALVAHHHQIPSFHVEAGLRTQDPNLPFPEEMNRRLVSRLATLHFAPTARARNNLLAEGVRHTRIQVTGNTGIDALHLFAGSRSHEAEVALARLRPGTRPLLVTLHRRENAAGVAGVTRAIQKLVRERRDVEVLWILHLNSLRADVRAALDGLPGVHLLEPQPYGAFVHLMNAAYFILTDSGGVQEEAPVLGKPVLVLRNDTERPEAVDAGCSLVVGCETARIVEACRRLLDEPNVYRAMSRAQSPFGDGYASQRIVHTLEEFFGGSAANDWEEPSAVREIKAVSGRTEPPRARRASQKP